MKRAAILLLFITACVSMDNQDSSPLSRIPTDRASNVYAMKISPSGKYLVSSHSNEGFNEHTINIWDIRTGQLLHKLKGHSKYIYTLDIDPLERFIVSGSKDRDIRIWDLATGESLRHLPEVDGSCIYNLSIDPSGFYLFTGGEDHEVKQHALLYGNPIDLFPGHENLISTVSASPYGNFLATGGKDNTVRVWSYRGGTDYRKNLYTFNQKAHVISLCFGADNQVLLAGDTASQIRVWDLYYGTQRTVLEGHSGIIWWIIRHPKENRFFSADEHGRINVWDGNNWSLLHTIQIPGDNIQSLAIEPRGRLLFTGGFSKNIKVWDLQDYSLLATIYDYPDASAIITEEGWFSGSGSYRGYLEERFFPENSDSSRMVAKVFVDAMMMSEQ